MAKNQRDVLHRLRDSIANWRVEVTGQQETLARQIDQTRRQLGTLEGVLAERKSSAGTGADRHELEETISVTNEGPEVSHEEMQAMRSLASTIVSWNRDVATTQERLTENLAQARAQLFSLTKVVFPPEGDRVTFIDNEPALKELRDLYSREQPLSETSSIRLRKLEGIIANLKRELATLREKRSAQSLDEDQPRQANQAVVEAERRSANLQSQMDELQYTLEGLTARLEESESKYGTAQNQNNRLTQELAELKEAYTKLYQAETQSADERHHTELLAEQHSKTLLDSEKVHETRVRTLERTVSDLRNIQEEDATERIHLKETIGDDRIAEEKAKAALASAEEEVQDLNKELDDYRRSAEGLETRRSVLERQLKLQVSEHQDIIQKIITETQEADNLNQKLRIEMDELSEADREKAERLEEAKNTHHDLRDEIRQLISTKDSITLDLASVREKGEELRQTLAASQKQVEEFAEKNVVLTDEKEDLKHRIKTFLNTHAAQEAHIRDLAQELDANKDMVGNLLETRAAQETRLHELTGQLDEQKQEIRTLRENRAALETQSEDLNKELEERKQEIGSLVEERAAQEAHARDLGKELELTRSKAWESESALAGARAEIDSLCESLTERDASLEEIRQLNTEVEIQFDAAQESLARNASQLEEERGARRKLSEEAANARGAYENAAASLASASSELDGLKHALEEKDTQASRALREGASLRSTLEDLRLEVERHKNLAERATEMKNHSNEEREALEEQLQGLSAVNAGAQAQLGSQKALQGARLHDLEIELEALRATSQEDSHTLAIQEAQMSSLQQSLANYEESLVQKNREIVSIKERAEDANLEKARLEGRIERSEKIRQELSDRIGALGKEKRALETELEGTRRSLDTDREEREGELEKRAYELEEFRVLYEESQASLVQAQAERDKMNETFRQGQKAVRNLKGDCDKLKDMADASREQIRHVEGRVQQAQRDALGYSEEAKTWQARYSTSAAALAGAKAALDALQRNLTLRDSDGQLARKRIGELEENISKLRHKNESYKAQAAKTLQTQKSLYKEIEQTSRKRDIARAALSRERTEVQSLKHALAYGDNAGAARPKGPSDLEKAAIPPEQS